MSLTIIGPRENFVIDIAAGDRNVANHFYGVGGRVRIKPGAMHQTVPEALKDKPMADFSIGNKTAEINGKKEIPTHQSPK